MRIKNLSLATIAAALALALALASCAENLPQRTVFQPTAHNAFVVLEAPPLPMASVTLFRRVDLQSHRFEREIVTITYAPIGGLSRLNPGSTSGVILVGHEIPPGDYAIVEVGGPIFNGQAWLCMSAASPAFHFAAGQIAIVRTNYIPGYREQLNNRLSIGNQAVLDEFAGARTHYPSITGDASIVAPEQIIAWPRTAPSFMQAMTRACAEPETFSAVSVVPKE